MSRLSGAQHQAPPQQQQTQAQLQAQQQAQLQAQQQAHSQQQLVPSHQGPGITVASLGNPAAQVYPPMTPYGGISPDAASRRGVEIALQKLNTRGHAVVCSWKSDSKESSEDKIGRLFSEGRIEFGGAYGASNRSVVAGVLADLCEGTRRQLAAQNKYAVVTACSNRATEECKDVFVFGAMTKEAPDSFEQMVADSTTGVLWFGRTRPLIYTEERDQFGNKIEPRKRPGAAVRALD
jgi:hypothetical protein